VQAVLLERTGSADVLRWTKVPRPEPGPGQLRVQVRAIGLNYAEVLSRKGLYGWAPKRPYVPGMEVAGVVEAAGSGVGIAPGTPVMVGCQYGAYAEEVVVPEAQALPMIEGLSMVEAAAFPVNFMTAWVALRILGRPRPGETVAISPAGGGVGTAAVQIAVAMGCRVVALAGSDSKLERVKELGVHATACYGESGFPEALQSALDSGRKGQGIDVAVEMVGGEVFRGVRAAMAPFGRMVVAGYASLDYRWWNPASLWRAWRGVPRIPLGEQFRRSLGLYATHLGYLLDDPDGLGQIWSGLTEFVVAHGLKPQVGHVLPARRIADAHRLMESRGSYGKIILNMSEGLGTEVVS
jgi:NADPH2:quinone reductase